MKNIENLTLLKIKTHDGNIEIPFISLEMLDEFTVRYRNMDELVDSLFAMLNLSVARERIIDVYVYYEYEKKGQIRCKNTRVKYSKHNFNKDRLVEFMKDFLNNNHDMIKCTGVRKIRSNGMNEFLNGYRDIEKYEVDDAVDKYFSGAPYGVYRKNYFFLIDNGVKPAINRVNRNNSASVSHDISRFYSDDEYIQSIFRSVQVDGDESRIYEELSKIDLEDLRTMLTNPHFGVFDGSYSEKRYTLEDLYDLEQCTGMDIDSLCDYVSNFRKGHKR